MLLIHDEQYMARVKAFATKIGKLDALMARLDYLDKYAGGTCTAYLYKDLAPASFEFVIKKNGETWFSGGLIYHGDQSGWGDGEGTPVFSVLIGENRGEWEIHT